MTKQIKTIKDIAEVLGISPSTVSRVLNKKGYYSPKIEEQVLKIVEESGFVYNMSAKGLRYSKSFTIGLMIPDISNAFFSSLALIVEQYFKERGYSLYICNTKSDPNEEFKHLNNFASNKVDGILCIAQLTKIPKNYEKYNIPIVAMDRCPCHEFPVTRIITDEYKAGFEIAELLIEKGCQNIILISGKYEDYIMYENTIQRIKGFRDGLKKHNKIIKEEDILRVNLSSEEAIFEAEAVVNSAIASGIIFDGIFALTDRFALGAVYALNNAGINVPNQVKVIGFDNSIYSMFSRPSISSVDRNLHLMGITACEKLFSLIESNTKIKEEEIIIPAKIIERESTKSFD